MSLPADYTEHTLADFMADEIGPLATEFSWAVGVSDAGSYQEAVNTVLEMSGVAAVVSLAVNQARAYGRIAIWRRVLKHASGDFNFSADGGSYSRSQIQEMAAKSLGEAESEAAALGYGTNVIGVGSVTYENDAYQYEDDGTGDEFSNLSPYDGI